MQQQQGDFGYTGAGQEMKCNSCLASFTTPDEQRQHYKSDWHRYNLKRKVAGLGPVGLAAFERKLELLASAAPVVKGDSHLKSKKTTQTHTHTSPTPATAAAADGNIPVPGEETAASPSKGVEKYSPEFCLFDGKKLASLEKCLNYMRLKYSFFLPDVEYLKDANGLMQYLGEKIWEGHVCIACNKEFPSRAACWHHMTAKGHTRLGTDSDELLAEIEEFFDYSKSYKELTAYQKKKAQEKAKRAALADKETPSATAAPPTAPSPSKGGEKEEEEDEWSDAGSDDSSDLGDPDDEAAFTRVLDKYGLNPAAITATGNLRLPDGREVAHRHVAYVYKQHVANNFERRQELAALALENKGISKGLLMLTANGEKAELLRKARRLQRKEGDKAAQKFNRQRMELGCRNLFKVHRSWEPIGA